MEDISIRGPGTRMRIDIVLFQLLNWPNYFPFQELILGFLKFVLFVGFHEKSGFAWMHELRKARNLKEIFKYKEQEVWANFQDGMQLKNELISDHRIFSSISCCRTNIFKPINANIKLVPIMVYSNMLINWIWIFLRV